MAKLKSEIWSNLESDIPREARTWPIARTGKARSSVCFFLTPDVWPAWDNRLNSTAEQERFAATVASAKSYVDAQLAPNEVALVPSYWPFADSRYFELVQIYVAHSPEYPYRYLPATAAVRSYEQPRQMRPGPFPRDRPSSALQGVRQARPRRRRLVAVLTEWIWGCAAQQTLRVAGAIPTLMESKPGSSFLF